ncbi:MAG: EamA family transporter [Kiritimatiellae bacterium]|nr:EamA family transporter [Kiritimatiellia bacterium]
MLFLFVASVVWALSFGLIKHNLIAPGIDPNLVAFVRLLLSTVVFLPLLQCRKLDGRLAAKLMLVGGVQYGLMYVFYTNSFRYLSAHLVALLTIFTPLYATLVHDLMAHRFHLVFLVAAVLAIAGTAVTLGPVETVSARWPGILFVQLSNLCFAAGQMLYRQIRMPDDTRDQNVFALLYLGGCAVAFPPALIATGGVIPDVSTGQMITLLYLGLVPSGLCFFLWNLGARASNPGTLAVMNNAKIPLAVLCSLLVFREEASIPRLLVGGTIIALAVVLDEIYVRRHVFLQFIQSLVKKP